MSSDTQKRRQLLNALMASQGKQAVTQAFEHVFDHLDRLNSHVSLGGPEGEGQTLKPGESLTLR